MRKLIERLKENKISKIFKSSIKLKITLWYTFIMVIISITALALMLSVSRKIIVNDYKNRLVEAVDSIIIMPSTLPGVMPGNSKRHPPSRFFKDGVHIAMYDENNNFVNGFMPFDFVDALELKQDGVQEVSSHDKQFLVYIKKIRQDDDGKMWLKGAVSIENQTMMLKSVLKTNLFLMGIMIFAAGLGGYLIVKKAFEPVSKISDTAKRISKSSDLTQRIALKDGKDELHELAETFDEMILKIESTLENEKQFTLDASHELRTPITVISSECEYALSCASNTKELRESLSSIKNQADKMTKLVSELLMLSRMDRENTKIELEEVDVSELLNFVCDEQEEIHKNKGILKRDIKEGIIKQIDKMLLARIFINIISNAYSYSKDEPEVNVLLKEDDENIIFMVSDNGIGIKKEDIDKIWERFYQVNPARNKENMGLGLSMVKSISEKLGIQVKVESEIDKGTIFTFLIKKE